MCLDGNKGEQLVSHDTIPNTYSPGPAFPNHKTAEQAHVI